MKPPYETPLPLNNLDYILEELTILEGCLPMGLGFPPPVEKTDLFIVYPGQEEGAFVEAKNLFKKFDVSPTAHIFNVQWLEIKLHQLTESATEDPHIYAEFVHEASVKQLLKSKNKYLLFLISIGKEYHEGNFLKATVNLFENVIRGCNQITEDEDFRRIAEEKQLPIMHSNWHIVVAAADTLQAYNGGAIEEWREKGERWINKEGIPIFKQRLAAAGQGHTHVSVKVVDWQTLRQESENYLFQKRRDFITQCYDLPQRFSTFYQAVNKKGWDFIVRQRATVSSNKLSDKSNLKQKKETAVGKKKIIGVSNVTHRETFSSLLSSMLFDWDPEYCECYLDFSREIRLRKSVSLNPPVSHSLSFVLRAEPVSQLQLFFRQQTIREMTETTIVIVHGSGGFGKSSLATYWYAHHPIYLYRFWINMSDVNNSFKRIAYGLGLIDQKTDVGVIIRRVTTWLEQHPGWLLVFDNVEDKSTLAACVPSKGGHVLITTRMRQFDENTFSAKKEKLTVNLLSLGGMTPSESLALLEKNAGRHAPELALIAKRVMGMPLALKQIGIALKANPSLTVNQYIDETSEIAHEFEKQASSAIATIYRPSFRQIIDALRRERYSNISWEDFRQCVTGLLAACTYLAPNQIPISFLEKCFDSQFPSLSKNNANLFRDILTKFIHYSIVDAGDSECVCIHVVVQEMLRSSSVFGKSAMPFNKQTILNQLGSLILPLEETMTRRYNSHLQILTQHVEKNASTNDSQTFETLLDKNAHWSRYLNDHASEVKYLSKLRDIYRNVNSDRLLLTEVRLIQRHSYFGYFQEAKDIVTSIIARLESNTNLEDYLRHIAIDPFILSFALSYYYLNKRELRKAKHHLQSALSFIETMSVLDSTIMPDKRQLIVAKINLQLDLAYVRSELNESVVISEVQQYYRESLSLHEQTLTIKSQRALATLYIQTKQYVAAEQVCTEALSYLQLSDPDRIEKGYMLQILGAAQMFREKLREAKSSLTQALEIFQKQVEPDLDIFGCIFSLYTISKMLNEPDSARKLVSLHQKYMSELQVQTRFPEFYSTTSMMEMIYRSQNTSNQQQRSNTTSANEFPSLRSLLTPFLNREQTRPHAPTPAFFRSPVTRETQQTQDLDQLLEDALEEFKIKEGQVPKNPHKS